MTLLVFIWSHLYVVFKKDGMVSKTLVLDTKKGYFEEDVEPRTFIEPSISLINRDDEVDYDIIENQPVGGQDRSTIWKVGLGLCFFRTA